MRERLVTLAFALAALALFVGLFVRGGGTDSVRLALPTTIERHGNGLRGAFAWLRSEGIRTLSLRERFDGLEKRRDLSASGNLLIMALPVATPIQLREARALDRWVRSGNTLLLLAALCDRPAWSTLRLGARNDLELLTGLDFETVPVHEGAQAAVVRAFDASRHLEPPGRGTLIPNRAHPYLSGVREAVALSDYPPQPWSVQLPRDGFVLSLAHQRENAEGVLWVRPRGAGSLIVSGFGSLFSNRALGLADNAQLLANLVALSVAADGAVLFDDEHQGLTAAYDPAHFYADPRLYRTLGVLALVWLAWVLGGTRLKLPVSRQRAPREAELVRATGVFLARVLRPAAAARRMFEHFFRRLPARRPGGELPWDWLEQHPRLAPADVRRLRDWYALACSDQRVPLTPLHNLLLRTERRLTA